VAVDCYDTPYHLADGSVLVDVQKEQSSHYEDGTSLVQGQCGDGGGEGDGHKKEEFDYHGTAGVHRKGGEEKRGRCVGC
jgi:hypothetical protein